MSDGGEGTVLRPVDRKWTKPLVLLINNRSYSDAEIFPSAFRALNLGKLVGQPTGGHVIGTGGVASALLPTWTMVAPGRATVMAAARAGAAPAASNTTSKVPLSAA